MGCDSELEKATEKGTEYFQYPRTDRMGCDMRNDAYRDVTDTSFSILERIEWAATAEGLRRDSKFDKPFSILERIEWAATTHYNKPYRRCVRPFSILERIEWAATSSLSIVSVPNCAFQYPRTDRMGCDDGQLRDPDDGHRPFSILERIEWAATSPPAFKV